MHLRRVLAPTAALLIAGCTAPAVETSDGEDHATGSAVQPMSYSTSNGVAWGWANNPTAPTPYSPPSAYAYNSAGGPITITRDSLGSYRVEIANFGDFGSNPHVVSHGVAGEFCRTGGAGRGYPDTTKQNLFVTCSNYAGALVDSRFVFFIAKHAPSTEGTGSHSGAYLRAENYDNPGPFTASSFDWNSTGAANLVTRTSVGVYSVWLPGITDAGGSVMLTTSTAYMQFFRCKVGSFYTNSSGTTVDVRCFDNAGPHDGMFFLHYSGRENFHRYGAFGIGGYVWGNNATSPSYTPSTMYQYLNNYYPTPYATAVRASTGLYTIHYPGILRSTDASYGDNDTALVTSYGQANDYCQVRSWVKSGDSIDGSVNCFNAAGLPTDAQYLHTYMTSRGVYPQ